MTTTYPTSLDSFTNPSASDQVGVEVGGRTHSEFHADINDAVEALQAKVGADSSAVTTSHDYKLSEVTGSDKAVGKTATQTLTNKTINGNSNTLTVLAASQLSGNVPLANGGTGASLSDPNANKLLGWNDSDGAMKFATVGSGLAFDGDTLTASSSNVTTNQTANEDLTAGTPVGISSVVGGIAKARAGDYTKTITPDSADDTCRTVKIATDKVVTAYRETTSNDLKVFVSTIDTTDYANAFTVGAVVSVTANLATGNETYDVCQVDTDKFSVTYVETGALTVVKNVIATVSGTTITLGTPVTAYTAAGDVSKITSCYVSADKAFFAVASNSGNGYGIAFTASGTVGTFGTPADLGSNSQADLICALINTDKIALSGNGYARVITLSGTTITVGTAVQFAATYAQAYQYHDIVSHTTDAFVVRFNSSSSTAQHCVMTVSGTTITAGTVQNALNGGGALYVYSSTQIISRASSSGFSKMYTISGTTITDDNNAKFTMQFTDCSRRKFVDMGSYGFTHSISGTSLEYSFVGMSDSFIGILQTTISQGQTGTVVARGIDTNQSGLIAGTNYLVSAGALTAIQYNATVNTFDDIQVVKAISSTSVLV